jgi:hypothetical protein
MGTTEPFCGMDPDNNEAQRQKGIGRVLHE